MAAAPIDLSAGLVPKPVDISAGLVPKAEPDAPKSLLQRAQDAFDKLTTVTPEQRAGHGAVVNAAQEFGAGAIQGAGAPIVHPLDTLEAIGHTIAHPIDSAHAEVDALRANPAKFLGNAVGGAVLGEAAAPAIAPVAEAVKTGAGKAVLLGKTPAEAYESALKPSTTLPPGQRAAVVQTGLSNEIPVSKQGLEDIGTAIDKLNQEIKGQIAADPTRPIDPNAVATRADIAKAKFANQVNAQPDLKAIEASKQQFLDEQGQKPGMPAQPTGLLDAQGKPIMKPAQPATPAQPMDAADAQTMKQGTYQVLRGKFGEQGSAAVEAQKALARGLKEEIATQFPGISKLNADESRLLDLQPILERAVNRISNHQAAGIGTPIAATAGKAITGSSPVGAVAGLLKMTLDNPMVKSRLAIMVSKGSKIPLSQATAQVQAYSAALGSAVGATLPTSDDQIGDQK